MRPHGPGALTLDSEEDDFDDEYELEDEEWTDEELEDDTWEESEDDEEIEFDEDEEEYAPREVSSTLSFGIVAIAPLVLLYECTLALGSGHGMRSVAEAILSLPLRPLPNDLEPIVRRLGLVVLLVLALVVSRRRGIRLGGRVLRVLCEGVVFALLLGPLLAFASSYAEPFVGPLGSGSVPGGESGSFAHIALAAGGAAYEEVLFRVLLLSFAFVVGRGVLVRVGADARIGAVGGALFGTLVSALGFAAIHVDRCIVWLGAGGEAFDAASFTWRAIAGIVLAGIVVWRGVGVAAWAHALFNLVRILGLS